MSSIRLENIKKNYNNIEVIKDFNLDIEDKEFLVLVGPSGCGKSTTLRMIAGLEEATSGNIYIDNRLVNNVLPKDRDIAFVFQNYALYPHMNVYKNMSFALEIRKIPKEEIRKRVEEVASILDISSLLNRKPKELSGGQRQRVALGRAMVRNPSVFLLDEPLSNLDAKLRVQMRTEIIKLHKKLQTTFIYVTHDQVEAMTMGSRIVVMKDGEIMQASDSKTIYNKPNNIFVASFIGVPQMNFINTKLKKDDRFYFEFCDNKIYIEYNNIDNKYIDKEVIIGIRPENIFVSREKINDLSIEAYIDVVEMAGSESYIYLNINNIQIIVKTYSVEDFKIDDKVYISFDNSRVHIFDRDTEKNIMI